MSDTPTDLEQRITATITRLSRPLPEDPSETVSRATPPEGPTDRAQPASDRFGLLLGSVLGVGGMGEVRLARQESLGRDVAVKTLRAGQSDPDSVELLLRESRVMGRLEHPNVTPVHGLAWDAQGGPQLVMKRIEGKPWRARLGPAGGLEALDEHLAILSTVCQAVHFAHARGVIHCDLKPSNVMLGEFGEVYLIDWGVAQLVDDPPESDRPLRGSPAYLAPEMLLDGRIDARTDVYLLGSTLHHVLTGTTRHRGEDTEKVLFAAALSLPFEYAPEVPKELATLANRACSRDPLQRPSDALAFRAAIDAYLRHRASFSIAKQAQAELDAGLLEVRKDPVSAQRRLASARFGFEQSLREWPENVDASDGLQRALRRILAFELEAGNAAVAERLFAELRDPEPSLKERVEALRREASLQGRTWGRSLVTMVTGTGSGLFIYAGGVLARRSATEPTPLEITGFLAVGLLVTLVGLRVFRSNLLDNKVYRQLMRAFALAIPLLAAGAFFGHRSGVTFDQLAVGACFVMAAFTLILANVVSGAFWFAFVESLVVCWFASADPTHALDWAAIAWIVHAFWIGWVMRPRPAERAPSR